MSLFNIIKNNKLIRSSLFIIIAFLGILYSYQYLFQTYFAMDEWSFWMQFLKYGPFHMLKEAGFIGSLTGAIRVGLYFTNDVYFYLFRLDIRPWQITFFALHLANTFLVYKILRKFKLSQFGSFLGAFFFGIASAGQEAISWPAAGIPVLGTTLFILITILLVFNFNKTKKMRFLVLAIVTSFISYLFRPTGLVTPALIVALVFLFDKRPILKRIPKPLIFLFVGAIALGLVRLVMLYSGEMNVLLKAGFNIFFFPFITLSHIFISLPLLYRLSYWFISFNYPVLLNDGKYFGTISYLVIGDFLSVVGSSIIVALIYFLYKNINKFNKKVLIFGLFLYFIQYLPIALNYPERPGTSYLESRHTYTSIIGVSIVLSIFFDLVISKFKTKSSLKRYVIIFFFVLVGIWLFKEMSVTMREVRAQAFADIAIKKTWDNLQSLKLPNSEKMVFYLESDRNYFYPDWYLPFKLPAAYMLPLAYYGRPFINKDILGVLQTNNVYINSGDKQYGYFTDIKPLAVLIKQGKVDINNVVGLHFIDGTYTFEDITQQTRKMIKNELR